MMRVDRTPEDYVVTVHSVEHPISDGPADAHDGEMVWDPSLSGLAI